MVARRARARILTPEAVPASPWRNGAGVTRELVNDPTGWRLSVADLSADASFSVFPGVDRAFLPLLDVVLVVDGRRLEVAAGSVATFSGESDVSVELEGRRGRAVNLMTVNGRCAGTLAPIAVGDLARADDATAVVEVDGRFVQVSIARGTDS